MVIIKDLLETRDYTKNYEISGWLITIVQTGALLEIFHSLFGLVKSPIMTSLIQVSSRLFLVWIICYQFEIPAVRKNKLVKID
jgi:very-long-chain (3R)-3-hydroxyacyl-CoA dehydratase